MRILLTIRVLIAREEGENGVLWSLAFILMTGIIAIVIGPAISSDWREFVGRPLP
jgi:hypothetical protein